MCGENHICTFDGINQIKVEEVGGAFSTRSSEKYIILAPNFSQKTLREENTWET
jgi:hypothetical protein